MNTEFTFPRVLHVGFNPIGSPTNTGLTLGSMFRAWPREQLFQLYTQSRQAAVAGEHAVTAPPMSAPLDGLARAILGDRWSGSATAGLNNSVDPGHGHVGWRVRAALTATTLNDLGPVWTGGHWVDEIRQWRPTVLHTLLGGVRITRLALSLSRRLDIPIVPHFMDDWLATLFTSGQFWGLARGEVERLSRAVLERAPLCLTIGTQMREEYTRRLGCECVVVGNSVDFEEYARPAAPVAASGGIRRLRYIGGLHLGRLDTLRDIGLAVAAHSGPDKWLLTLSVPNQDLSAAEALANENAAIEVAGTLQPSEIAAALVSSDALAFVESSVPTIASFTRLSISTKVPEYLAARRPILAVGPADQASVCALRQHARAHYGGDGRDRGTLRSAFAAVTAEAASGNLRQNSEIALREFGTAPTQQRLAEALARAAGPVGRAV